MQRCYPYYPSFSGPDAHEINVLSHMKVAVKFIYSEKATKFCEISTLLLSVSTVDKSKVEILQNFVAFSEYMNFTIHSFELNPIET